MSHSRGLHWGRRAGALILLCFGLAGSAELSRAYDPYAGYACHEWRRAAPYFHDCFAYRDPCRFRSDCYREPGPPTRHRWRSYLGAPPEERDPVWHPRREARRTKPPPPLPPRRPDPRRKYDEKSAEKPESDHAGEAEPDTATRTARRKAAERGEIPARYEDMRNTVGHTVSAIMRGARLYSRHCASCHGADGKGGGPRAQKASPTLPSLAYSIEQPYSTDAYLMWTIMQGGKRFGTDKPAFEGEISERDAWRIIAYMRAGFPRSGERRAAQGTITDD